MEPITIAGISFVVLIFLTTLFYVLVIRNKPHDTVPTKFILYAKAGEVVTCTGGHEICDLAKDIFVADLIQTGQFTNWRNQEPPEPHSPIMPCKTCGEPFIKGTYGMQLYINGEWRTTHGY